MGGGLGAGGEALWKYRGEDWMLVILLSFANLAVRK